MSKPKLKKKTAKKPLTVKQVAAAQKKAKKKKGTIARINARHERKVEYEAHMMEAEDFCKEHGYGVKKGLRLAAQADLE